MSRRWRGFCRSRTIAWGHVQMFLGAIATALSFVNPTTFDGLPKWAYGVCAMLAGVITYILRSVTRKPLEDR